MSKEAVDAGERAVLSALDGIVRMQCAIRGGLDVGAATALVAIRIYYNALSENIARRLTELNPVAVAAIPGATALQGSKKARENIAASVASDVAFAQAIRAANVYREKLGFGLLGADGKPEWTEGGSNERQ